MLGEDFYTIIDHLSRALQKESLSAVEARAYAAVTVSTLMEKRSDDYFERFWDRKSSSINLESKKKSLLYHAKEEHQAELTKMQGQISTTKHPGNFIRDTTLRLQTNSQVKFIGSKHPNLSYTLKLKDCSRRLLMAISLIMTLFKR